MPDINEECAKLARLAEEAYEKYCERIRACRTYEELAKVAGWGPREDEVQWETSDGTSGAYVVGAFGVLEPRPSFVIQMEPQ